MGAPKLAENVQKDLLFKNPTDALDFYLTDELVIGLCGQLGTDLTNVSNELSHILTEEYNYSCEEIHLSDYLFPEDKPEDDFERIKEGMDLGDLLRKDRGNNILASLAISKILNDRVKETPKEDLEKKIFKSRRKCYIINSLKHPDEFYSFYKIYGQSFYLIGVFSSESERKKNLIHMFSKKDHIHINELLKRDNESDQPNGQKLRSVFVKSDYFIRYSQNKTLTTRINRFINLIFDFGINSPNNDENAMYQATAAAANSACLSRQVGACITDKFGAVLSTGWNDVPKNGGGVYLSTDKNDQRCYCKKWKKCTNSFRKDNMIKNIVKEIKEIGLNNNNNVTNKFIEEQIERILKKNGIKDLIEFGRSVHAEMYAIINGSQQTGDKMIGGNLYCTTYPCHNCARHIIMAGIKNIYYIEPYPKSLCLELHKDAITESETETNKVKILMYEGVAPKSFIKFYQLISDDRKIKVNGQNKKELKPKHRVHLESIPEKEIHFVLSVKDILINE